MQPLLNGYSNYIKGNILEVAFRPCMEKLGFFKNEHKEHAEHQEKKNQNDKIINKSDPDMSTPPLP